jgi:transposase IS66 family protein
VVLCPTQSVQAQSQPAARRRTESPVRPHLLATLDFCITLDRLLKRLLANKDELLRVLERPEISLNTDASENDVRACVSKRKVSGGTVSENGRTARDVMLGLAKTCANLEISFCDHLGAPARDPGTARPTLASLIAPTPS